MAAQDTIAALATLTALIALAASDAPSAFLALLFFLLGFISWFPFYCSSGYVICLF